MFKVFGFVVLSSFACIGLAFTAIFVMMQFGLLNVRGANAKRNTFFESAPVFGVVPKATSASSCLSKVSAGVATPSCSWNQSEEWSVIAAGLGKDAATIRKVSDATGVDPRMIAAAVVPEQMRFFTSERETYKKFFEPLKVLGSMTKFSLGVSGMKQETAKAIERNTVDTNSAYYAGTTDNSLVSYPTAADHDTTLYNRLTDNKDHYYSYLYTALYLKQIQAQWAKAGYDISARPDVLVTLFNVGFAASKPKDNPQLGGSEIKVGGKSYSFGLLGMDFYHSDELVTLFSR